MSFVGDNFPSLIAGGQRLSNWYQELSRREQWLVAVLGALLIAVALFYAVVRPIQTMREEANAKIRTHELLQARILAAGSLSSTPQTPRRAGSVDQILLETAAAKGLTIAPVAENGRVRVAMADVRYDALIGWMADLVATSDVRVGNLRIERLAAPGHVAAQMEFQ